MRVWSSYYNKPDAFLWFRIFGVGLVIKDVRKNPLLFSERSQLCRTLRIGNFLIRGLKRDRMALQEINNGFHYNKEHDVWECDKCGAWIGGNWAAVERYHNEFMCGKGHGCEP